MAPVRALAAAALLLLAGCAAAAPRPAEGVSPGAAVEGVIVTGAIVPLQGATVSLAPAGKTAVSDADGRFRFEAVPAGDHFLTATHAGYLPTQAAVTVEDGIAPPLVQLVLDADRATSPYVEAYSFQGYLDLSFHAGDVSGSAGGLFGQPRIGTGFTLASRLPDLAQAEMVWTPTQEMSRALQLTATPQNGSAVQTVQAAADGPSPLLLRVGASVLQGWGMQGGQDLGMGAFVGNNTPPPLPGVGFAMQQPFDLYAHLFYGYLPPDGWRFTSDGAPPPA